MTSIQNKSYVFLMDALQQPLISLSLSLSLGGGLWTPPRFGIIERNYYFPLKVFSLSLLTVDSP